MFEPLRLEDMTMEQLLRERSEAHKARIMADYVEGLGAWREAFDAAQLRFRAANAEIERRKQNG